MARAEPAENSNICRELRAKDRKIQEDIRQTSREISDGFRKAEGLRREISRLTDKVNRLQAGRGSAAAGSRTIPGIGGRISGGASAVLSVMIRDIEREIENLRFQVETIEQERSQLVDQHRIAERQLAANASQLRSYSCILPS